MLNIDMFDGCTVPTGLDMDAVRGAIVMRCGLLTPLFSEPLTMKAATQQFFAENQWNFEHLIKIIEAEYSPIENVFEVRNEDRSGIKNHVEATTIKKAESETETHTISAENVSSYQSDRQISNISDKSDAQNSNGNENTSDVLKVNRHGNIGVTTNQHMINEEIDLTKNWNVYKQIAQMYESTLMLGIY